MPDGKKILMLVRSLHVGGVERQLVALAVGLRRRGHSVLVAPFYPGGALEEELRRGGVPMAGLGKRGRWDAIPFLGRLAGVVCRERPDVLYSWLPSANLAALPMKALFPRLRLAWGVGSSEIDLSLYDAVVRLTYRAERLLSRFADLVIVNSRAGWNHCRTGGFPIRRLVMIPNGIDTRRFTPDPEAGAAVRTSWGVGRHEKLVGLVARLDPVKDHPGFLEAAALLRRGRSDVRFVCVGGGPENYRSELCRLGSGLGLGNALVWAGERLDMPAVYSALDAAVLASMSEGLPNTVGEAMACGVPCVVTDVGDSAWVVGDAGVVVPPRDPAALAGGIESCLAIGNGVGERARARIVENLGMERLIERTEEALCPKD